MYKCPSCSEKIQDGAIICRHCKFNLTDDISNSTSLQTETGSNQGAFGVKVEISNAEDFDSLALGKVYLKILSWARDDNRKTGNE